MRIEKCHGGGTVGGLEGTEGEKEGRRNNGGRKDVTIAAMNCSLTSHVKACTMLSSVAMATRSVR